MPSPGGQATRKPMDQIQHQSQQVLDRGAPRKSTGTLQRRILDRGLHVLATTLPLHLALLAFEI
jgi:hypothetical protein